MLLEQTCIGQVLMLRLLTTSGRCTICAKYKASQTVQPHVTVRHTRQTMSDIPESAADYFTHKGKDYLLIADTFSKYSFIYKVHSKTSDSVTQCLQDLFCSMVHHSISFLTMDPPFPQISFHNSYHHMPLITLHPHPFTPGQMVSLSDRLIL